MSVEFFLICTPSRLLSKKINSNFKLEFSPVHLFFSFDVQTGWILTQGSWRTFLTHFYSKLDVSILSKVSGLVVHLGVKSIAW